MRRILHVLSDTDVGGAGRMLRVLLQSADRERFCHALLLPEDSRLREDFFPADIPVYTARGLGDRSFSFTALIGACRVIRVFSPDIVHTHGCVSARLAAWILRVPRRIYTRHTCAKTAGNAILRSVNRRITTDAVAVSSEIREQIARSGIAKTKITVIRNGCGAPISLPDVSANKDPEVFSILYLGRLTEEKGISVLLRGMAILYGIDRRVRLTICGDGKDADVFRREADALSLWDTVTFLGFCREPERILPMFDAVVNASEKNEGCSMALIEGMRAGLLPICSDIPGNRETAGDCAVFFAPGDADSFADAVLALARDAGLRKRLSSLASERSYREFRQERMVREYEALWEYGAE